MTNSLMSDRVTLRRIRVSDAQVFANQSHTETESRFPDPRVPMSALSFEHWIAHLDTSEHVFAICRTGDDMPIGSASIRGIDEANGTASTGMGLFHAQDRGIGIGSEVKALLLMYAFASLGLAVLDCEIAATNLRSIRAVEKQGYRYAGRLTGAEIGPGGRVVDTLVYTIDRETWEAQRTDSGD